RSAGRAGHRLRRHLFRDDVRPRCEYGPHELVQGRLHPPDRRLDAGHGRIGDLLRGLRVGVCLPGPGNGCGPLADLHRRARGKLRGARERVHVRHRLGRQVPDLERIHGRHRRHGSAGRLRVDVLACDSAGLGLARGLLGRHVRLWRRGAGEVRTVIVSPDGASVEVGKAALFKAHALDAFGNAITGAGLTWGVTGGIGTITPNGVFTASTTVGVGFVTATHSSGRTGRQQVTIVPAAPATLDIALTSTSLSVDSQSVIAATARDAYGNANPDGEVRWTTTGTGSILLLTPDGRTILYHAPITTTPASVQLTATLGAVSRTITVTLVAGPPVGIAIDAPATTVAVGGTLDFGAIVTDQFGNAVTGATVAWKTTAGSIN